MAIKLTIMTALAMLAFAANSVLCRMALSDVNNDAISFTLMRLLSGAVILFIFVINARHNLVKGFTLQTMSASVSLFLYALFFSLAYIDIDAGSGALILFASVQFTMMIAAFIRGERLIVSELIGIILALTGFIYLLLPGASVPSLIPALLMMLSGIAWGAYCLLGQDTTDPIQSTARNFVLCLPLVVILLLVLPFALTNRGMLLAVLSGALTSGLGYVLWYVVLRQITTSTAAIVQLSVPMIAMFGGVLLLDESLATQLVIASTLILGGIYIKTRAD